MKLKKTIVGALAGILLLGAVGIPQAQAVTSIANDPGPAGDFAWKGFNWQKRPWAGAPMYNGSYSADNVSNPDANGYVTLNLSNPTGEAPSAAEFQSTRRGFGYGTYTATVEKNINSLQKEVVWGCLFTYDQDAPPGMNEIDLCEASAWGGGASYGQAWPVTQGHGYWFDATKPPGTGNNTVVFNATDAPILTHKMVWEPGKITFETYAGSGYTGTLLKRTVLQGSTVPIPAKENVVFNLWVTGGGGGDPAHVKPEKVIIRDFTFTPAATATATPLATTAPILNPVPTATTPSPSTSSSTPTNSATPTFSNAGTPTSATSFPTATAATTAAAIIANPVTPTTDGTAESLIIPVTTTGNRVFMPSTGATIKLSANVRKYKRDYRTVLGWKGTSDGFFYLYVDGVKKLVFNTGKYIVDANAGSTHRYQLCDSKSCSDIFKVKV